MELTDKALERAIRELDTGRVVDIVEDHFLHVGTTVPDGAIDLLATLLMRDDVASLPDSWQLVSVLDPEWQFLSKTQVECMLVALQHFFQRCDDEMAAFAVGAAIGEHDHSQRALEVLAHLAQSEVKQERRRGAIYGLMAMAERNDQQRPLVRSVLTRLLEASDFAVAHDAAQAIAEIDKQH
jgi:hypothetical protein